MERMTFSKRGGRVRTKVVKDRTASDKSTEDVVRDIKTEMQKSPGKDYRERSLAIHGLVCARCAREFNETSRHLLTVHHKDGNHENNPADGSNWENLCVYCHDDVHSRGLLGDYLGGSTSEKERVQVYGTEKGPSGEKQKLGILGDKLLKAIKKKNGT
jgi:5-methylcytosine-specific restriction endonuclease McrA